MDRDVASVMPVSTLAVLSEGRMADGGSESAFDVVPIDTCVWGSAS